MLGRISLKSFKTLPGVDQAGVPLPPDTSILGSNLYSVPGDDIRGFHSGNLHAYIRVYFVKGYI